MAEDPYTDPVTGVLLSKLGLGTAAELAAAEREITHAALILLGESPVHPGYDLPHVCAIHRRIFGDIYDWAGQIRTAGIAKGSLFCLPQHIETSAAEIFRALRSENCLRDLDREASVARLAYYLGEVNAVHPFREGSGRIQRAFFEQLAATRATHSPGSISTPPGTSRPPPRSCAATRSPCGRCPARSFRTESSQHYGAANSPMDMRASAQSALQVITTHLELLRLAPVLPVLPAQRGVVLEDQPGGCASRRSALPLG